MKRTMSVLAIGFVLASASPAVAKVDVERIVVEGPGLAAPVELVDEDAFDFLIGGRMAGPSGAEVTAEPHGDLGDGYTVTVYQASSDDVDVLRLYPYADPAWLRLNPGDGWVSVMLRGPSAPRKDRWAPVNERQLRVLRKHGLPVAPSAPPTSTAPPVSAEPEVTEAAEVATVAGPASPPWTERAKVVALLAAVIVVAALAGRAVLRRRPRTG